MTTKVFVGGKGGNKTVYVLTSKGGVQLLTPQKRQPEALEYLENHLPPLTEEEKESVSHFGVNFD